MYRSLFFTIVFLSAISLSAQNYKKNEHKGFLVTTAGDTIQGALSENYGYTAWNGLSIKFRFENGKKKRYNGKKIKVVQTEDDIRFESKKVKNNRKELMQRLLYNNEHEVYFRYKILSKKEELYLFKKGEEKGEELKRGNYVPLLRVAFSGCPYFNSITRKKVKFKKLLDYIYNYDPNDCGNKFANPK